MRADTVMMAEFVQCSSIAYTTPAGLISVQSTDVLLAAGSIEVP